jgi:CMP-N-acetylneuraminic acid synthetase
MVIGIIPARGGSKGVPKKNIRGLAGHPLIAYSIVASRLSKGIDRTVVSTDSKEIAEIAESYGAEAPFLRPEEYARDDSPDIEFIRHAIEWFRDNEGKCPEYLVHLRPTTPLRDPAVIDGAIRQISGSGEATSLRSVHEIPESPYKLFGISEGFLVGLYPDDPRPEYYNLPRQSFPPVYKPNGYVDIIKPGTVQGSDSLHGPRILSYITPDTGELDREDDFYFIEYRLKQSRVEICEYLKKHY